MLRDPLASVRIRYKLPLTFLAICLVAFGIGGVVLTSEARAALEGEIEQRLDERASTVGLIVERHLDLLRRRVEDFASDGHIRGRFAALVDAVGREDDDDAATERTELARHFNENKLSLVDAFVGAVLYSTDGAPLVIAPDQVPGDAVVVPETTVSDLMPSSVALPYPTFRIATPLWSLVGGRRIGSLEIVVRADAWIASMDELATLPPLPLRAVELVAPSGVHLSLAPDLKAGDDDGRETGAYKRQVAGPGWQVELEVDRERAMAPADRLRNQYLWIGLALLLITAGVLFFPVRFLLQPLSGIAETARRIGEGDFEARVDHESGDEIGDLSRAFNVMAGAVEDRTERLENAADAVRRREQEIRLERDRLGAVIHSMRDGLFILDADGRVTLANAAAQPVIAALSPDGDMRRLECLHAPETEFPCFTCLADTASGHQSCVVQHEERIYDVQVTTLPAAPDTRPGRLCVSRDVTQRIDLQERQAHQERLAVLGEIAAVMAHELNNPLAAISMFAQMLETQLDDGSDGAESASVIRRNVETCKQTIHGLLDLAARGQVDNVEFDMHDMLSDVRTFLRPITERARVSVDVDFGAGASLVTGDEVRLRQVFVNLVMNAVQACDTGGAVLLRTRDGDGVLEIEVEDTGTGIPDGLRARIFEPFFTTKGAGTGTGLGLPTSRRIVEEHGGTLTLDTSSGSGTRFRVALPRKAAMREWETEARLSADVGAHPQAGRGGRADD